LDLRPGEEREQLRAGARALLVRECPPALVRATVDGEPAAADALWARMAEAGWTGLPFPEAFGGAELGLLDLVVVCEELGRVLAPGPFLASVALAGQALWLAGDDAQRGRWLPDLAAGRSRGALAFGDDGDGWDALHVRLAARRHGGGWVLTGRKRFVPGGASADWLLVVARAEDGALAPFLVEAGAPGLARRPVTVFDATRDFAELTLSGVFVGDDARLPGGAPALGAALDRARVALCGEMLGSAARMLEASVEHACTRRQFGRPIGSFQAVQHRCADLLVALEQARSATAYAAWAQDAGAPDAARAAASAKVLAGEAVVRCAEGAIQLHGGLGFTWEQDLHLHYRRAKVSERLLGDPDWLREQVARALLEG
jgi:alkylation response protein AidB-like acyl-CoA dehydrogenase